jgi:hypothetical protein
MGAPSGRLASSRFVERGELTVKGPNFRPARVLLPIAALALTAHAMGSDSAQQCSGIDDDRERLACYDAIFRATTGTPSGTSVDSSVAAPVAAVPAAAAAATAAARPQEDFGLTEAAKRARDPEKAKEDMLESITGVVAAVDRRPAGELIVTLADGQVWVQLSVDRRARVAVGDTVTVKKAALGSHLLVTANRYATRVRRVK